MNLEKGIYFVAILVCALVFLAISIYAFLSKKPINFWAGEKISVSQVTDVKMYNRANGIMWLVYGICWLIAAVIGLFSSTWSARDLRKSCDCETFMPSGSTWKMLFPSRERSMEETGIYTSESTIS